ncbi:HD domain-containing protein [Sporosarcina koreensis]|uniref:HD domain-containing protein n=1 Tax=Sporosarcina koreensis TaxID=334735 RepID=UPI00058CF13A|nr:HD domain-containing protein [Sporosarcina koreensis]
MTYIQQCAELTKDLYSKFDASHDMDHILRVLQNARTIMEEERTSDRTAVELAVYLHDIDDPKYAAAGNPSAADLLKAMNVPAQLADHVLAIIRSVSFNGGNEEPIMSPEAAIVRDADRLDAIGAVGIARAFAFGGARGRKLYDWEESSRSSMTEEEYRSKNTSTVTHFHEKLFLLKDLMVTERGRQLAQQRHTFMEAFLKQLELETGERL